MDDQALNLRGHEGSFGLAEHHEQDAAKEAFRYAWRPAGSRSLKSGWARAGEGGSGRAAESELHRASELFQD